MKKDLIDKYANIDLEMVYETMFDVSAPYYDMTAEYKTIEEWEEIMIYAIENKKPFESNFVDDVDY